MKLRFLAGVTTLALAIIACSLSSSIPSFSNSGSTSYTDISQAVDPNTQPIPLTTTLDENHTATAIIGPDGGSLSTTGADGTKFTLDIPPKALAETIEVSMIPIASMDGIPWKSGPVAAVQLEPDGQTFYDYATLTIVPAGDIPADQFIPIGASGPGHDLYIPTVDPKSNTIQLKLDHFSSAGATKGLLADIGPWRQRLGGDVEARLSSIISAELARARETGQDVDPGFWDWAFSTWKKYVLQPRLDAAGESCAAGRLAIDTLIGFERQNELWGHPFPLDVTWTDLLPKVSRVCVQEEYELCRDQHIIHRMIPVILGMERQDELMGYHESSEDASSQAAAMRQVEAEALDLARKCLNFELQFESSTKMSTQDGSYTSAVEATVPIKLNTDTITLEGSGELTNTDFTFKPNSCSARSIPGGGTFKVISLIPIDAPPDSSHPYGYVKAIHLNYEPGKSSETTIVTCPQSPSVTTKFPFWSMGYDAIHANAMEMAGGSPGNGSSPLPDISGILGSLGVSNLPNVPGLPQLPGGNGQSQGNQGGSDQSQDNGPTFLAKEWAVRGGELFAQKEWQMSVNLATTGTEEGSFKLYHRPQ